MDREEYVEQAHFFKTLRQRMRDQGATQEVLSSLREELLSTAKLPLAVDFMASELRHHGVFGTALRKLSHYFTSFQAFVVEQAEHDEKRFDLQIGLEILEQEASYRAGGATPQGVFFFQFECVSRNRLGYDKGLAAIGGDPIYDDAWREWLVMLRRQIGIVDFADLVYVRSAYCRHEQQRLGHEHDGEQKPILFGEKEGRIALANRRKDPLLMFLALQRHLGYPSVPRPRPPSSDEKVVPLLLRRVERLETRLKLLEEDARGGFDLSQFYEPPSKPRDV